MSAIILTILGGILSAWDWLLDRRYWLAQTIDDRRYPDADEDD